jgi:hypothetical protein
MHVDDGLLIAMTTGLYSNADSSTKNGLYMELPTGAIVEVEARDDALIIMVGKGGATWLAPLLGLPFRAVPHALSIRMKPSSDDKDSTRAWYGKMFLPPSDARIPYFDISWGIYRNQTRNLLFSSKTTRSDIIPAACGGESHRYALTSSTACETNDGDAGVMCWAQCMSVSGLSCGGDAICYDTGSNEEVDGNIMCPSGMQNCELQCPSVMAANSTTSMGDYCYGRGLTMYMDGFRSIAMDPQKTPCINLFFTNWTLNNRTKFGIACVGVFFFGIFIQFLTYYRISIVTSKISNWGVSYRKYAFVIYGLLHGIQAALGYFAMLIAMTYNIELFCMICIGLAVGYVMFNLNIPPPIEVDPCCIQEIPVERKDGYLHLRQ